MRPMVALPALALSLTLTSLAPVSGSAAGDRELAQRSLSDVRASVAEIVAIENGYAVGHDAYRRAAERARNALVGRSDGEFAAAAGDPGDGTGALGHVDRLLDRDATEAWTPALQGAKINLLAAVQSLGNALGEKQMESYQNDLSIALADISLAVGRSSERGVLGGIEGALASTTLGIPAGSRIVPGCAEPAAAPAYGVVSGRLTFVSLARTGADMTLPAHLSVHRIRLTPNRIVLFTGGAADTASLCRARTSHAHRLQFARDVAGHFPYTRVQAKAGAKVYAHACISCHGANLQGTAGPAVAGTEFLRSTARDKWSLADLRNIVTQQMPLNNPGTLSPKEYADVIAYLLASSCFPATKTPFPTADSPMLAKAKLAPVPGAAKGSKLGTCPVK